MSGNQGRKQGSETPLPSPSRSVRFFPFGEGGVLFFVGTQRLWVLNAASASIWCLLPEVGSLEELTAALATRFAIDAKSACRDALDALATFEREGLLVAGRPQQPDPGADRDAVSACGPPLFDPPAWGLRRFLRTPGRVFEFCSTEAAYGDGFVRILNHLSVKGGRPPTPAWRSWPAAGASTSTSTAGAGWPTFLAKSSSPNSLPSFAGAPARPWGSGSSSMPRCSAGGAR